MQLRESSISDALYRVKRGLSGYVSYLAACEMNESFSEYILYEPILRILTARGFHVKSEVPCPGIQKVGPGDFKKIDFVATHSRGSFSLEVKWAKARRVNDQIDVVKLLSFIESGDNRRGFLCVFGRRSVIQGVSFASGTHIEQGNPVYAEFGVTRFGCRIFEVSKSK
jgi:hypothetical protein